MSLTTSHLPHHPKNPQLDKMSEAGKIKRRMTLPSEPKRPDPIFKAAEKPCEIPSHAAAFILLHGLGDNAEGLEGKKEPRREGGTRPTD
jgi:hypothetical protein